MSMNKEINQLKNNKVSTRINYAIYLNIKCKLFIKLKHIS